VFADTSVFLDLTTINKASSLINEIGVDRFMFGSDYPFFTPKNMLNKVEKLYISEEEKEMILSKNAIRILKL
jgi:predicted TIM-barrel fold metal-dependent hydrolase